MKVKPDTYARMKAEILLEFNSHKQELKTALLSATDYQAGEWLWQQVWSDKLHDDSHPRFLPKHGDKRIHAFLTELPANGTEAILYPDGTNDTTLATALKAIFAEIRKQV